MLFGHFLSSLSSKLPSIIIATVIFVFGIFLSCARKTLFLTSEKDVQVARNGGRGGGEVIRAMPERKHSFLKEVFPYQQHPEKVFFSSSDWKRSNEVERVALGHFHERVGESPRSYKNFGTSGSKIARFVSEIWPFEVGIGVRADFTK